MGCQYSLEVVWAIAMGCAAGVLCPPAAASVDASSFSGAAVNAAARVVNVTGAPVDLRALPVDVPGGIASDRVIVRVAPGVDLDAAGPLSALLTRWRVEAVEPALSVEPGDKELASRLGLDRYWVLRVPRGTDTVRMASELGGAGGGVVESAEVDSLAELHGTPPDPLLDQQWGVRNTGQFIGGITGVADADADVLEAWSVTRGVETVVVAVLDSGVSMSHPDILPNRLAGRNTTGGNVAATDDDASLSHGTHVAGIVAAGWNGYGVVGVAPFCKVLPVKVLTAVWSSETWTGNGLVWAADQGARVANLSLGHSVGGTFLRNAVIYADSRGMLMCASTGNSPGAAVGAPARWEPVIAVSSSDSLDGCSSFATTGPEVDISAPGTNIMSAWDTTLAPDSYQLQSGTSMACPMVAGTAALMFSANHELGAAEVRDLLVRTAEDKGPVGWDASFGWGRLNTYSATLAARATLPPCFADWNQDYAVTTNDIFDFLSDWYAGNADFNESGGTDTQDVFDFLWWYTAGC